MTASVAKQRVVLGAVDRGLAAGYVLPTIIAVTRQVASIATAVILNCFPISWPAALLLACMMPRKEPW